MLPATTTSTTIDNIILQLEAIISECIATNNRAGYFAALYHRVTVRIKEGIMNKEFENNERMELFDVTFAQRYLDAWTEWKQGKQPTSSWKIAFEAVAHKKDIVLQHLLLGMNAHINLDLGIATVITMDGGDMEGIKNDFNKINSILAALVNKVEDCLVKVNPLMKLLSLQRFNFDELLVQFSIDLARKGAWDFATTLCSKTGTAYNECIASRDAKIAELAANLARPDSWLLRFTVRLIYWYETKNVGKNIADLQS
ncbi:DUF5995 family protein [Taibaiella soli]|uniref:Uncharacterized protein n=1 Tax=Taibaiella soli TaxID=1649169 RepID=A0A2W2ADU0_9BACT|nr:DUF5995 family protein [Taibaiella soli]PZF73625.1 hypothetical protein DN068_07840 [Taibaiella soli]